MTYATLSELTLHVGEAELLKAAGTGDRANRALDLAKIDRALGQADATINSYLAKRYVTPVPDISGRLEAIACDIARYHLRNRSEGNGNTADVVRDRYKDAIKQLEEFRAGDQELEGAIPTGGQSSGQIHADTGRHVFSAGADGLAGFVHDW